ncbi:hypothetical protein [Deinococcus arcticus]|nr:hypothetical protein [Deinococcus arcticus]
MNYDSILLNKISALFPSSTVLLFEEEEVVEETAEATAEATTEQAE